MEGEIDENAVLDFAVFHTLISQNRYDATVCSKGIMERIATGPLDQLASHLPEANNFHSRGLSDSFKLELDETTTGFSWFTKSTVLGFLYLVNAPEWLTTASRIENEISQLEDTRKFHLALYTKGLSNISAGMLGDAAEGLTPKVKADTSNATKNELLRAMDVRLTALKEELSSTYSRALTTTSSAKQISDMAAFCQYFGAVDMRNSLLKVLELSSTEQASNASDQLSALPHNLPNNNGKTTEVISQPISRTETKQAETLKSVRTGASPAKIAQAERQSSSESEKSSDSSEEDQPSRERSRPLIRSASPRRSASPMRRIQIGRSGSRRPTALTIKSLSYFPARERTTYKDADGNGSGDEESDQLPNKTESSVRRMSVQDAINLFESKQRDQNLNTQSRKVFSEISASSNKSVLRRWSAGMGESSKQSIQVNSPDGGQQSNTNNPVPVAEEKDHAISKPEADVSIAIQNIVDIQVDEASDEERITSPPIKCPVDLDIPNAEESQEKPTDAAEWTRQKEAELNQMLLKLMESKPSKYRSTTSGTGGNQALSGERRGVLHNQHKEKNAKKLQTETDGKRAQTEAQVRMASETPDQRKTKATSKASVVPSKSDSLTHAQKSRKNSSPPVLSKKETSKPAAATKTSPKTSSPVPTTRSSWPSIPSPRTARTPPSRASTITPANNTTPTRRKPQHMPSPPSCPSPKPERTLRQSKGTKATQNEGKTTLKSNEDKKKNSMMSSRSATTKLSSPSGNDSGAVSAKPGFYNKAKKSSVVPLESKPFLRKGTGSGQSVGSILAKTPHQSDDSARTSENLVPDEEKESVEGATEAIPQLTKEVLVEQMNSDDKKFEDTVENDANHEITRSLGPVAEIDNGIIKLVELPLEGNKPDEDMDISSAAWVEADQRGISESFGSDMPQMGDSDIVPVASSSPRIRHSLSQMLQADNGEPEILEWGNAENPPALIYQKDAPKGLKRLLNFARKSKEVNLAGWSSPSVFSEGEDDTEEARTNSKRNTDTLLRKATLHTKGFGKQKTLLSESYDGGYPSKRSMDHSTTHEILPAQSCTSNFPSSNSHKLREGHLSTSVTSSKATRSFFSLSTFRSSKSSETNLR